MLKRRDVVDLEEARLTTLLATPAVTVPKIWTHHSSQLPYC